MTLSPADLAIVGAYIVAMTLFGAWFTKRQKDLRTYFVGGRDAGWLMVLLSIVATETSAVTFLSVPGLGYDPAGGDFRFLQLALGYIVGRCLVAWFLLPQYMRGDLFSAYEVLRARFSPAVQRAASGIFLLTRTAADGLRVYLTALLLQYIFNSVEAAILVVGGVTILYTYLGGMKAVLWTDVVQFAVKITGAAFAAWYVVRLLPGGWPAYLEQGEALGRFRWLDTTFSWASASNVWVGVVGGAVLSMASHGADQMMVQRYLCARSLGHARLALALSGVVVLLQFVLFLALGVGLFLLHRAGLFPEAAGRAKDEVFGLFIVRRLPVGVAGVLVAAVLAAAMSTLSSSLNSSANAAVADFYRPLRPGRPERHYVAVGRGLTAAWGALQMLVAYLAHAAAGPGSSVVTQVLAVAGFTTGLLLGLFVLGSLRRPVRSGAALVGLLAGFAAVLAVWLTPLLPGSKTGAYLAWPWYAPVGAGTTVLAGLAANLFWRPRAWPPTR